MYCRNHYPRKKKIECPQVNEITSLVKEQGFRGAGRILGVSDNAIRKHLRVMGLIG